MIVPWIDLATAAYEAGFRGEAHAIAVALAQPESGRNTDAVNSNDPNGGSFGLLQINGVHDPNATGTYPNMVPTAEWKELMKSPVENYKVAFKVWNNASRSFNPWGAYTSDLHMPYMATAKVALDARSRLARLDVINANHLAARAALQNELSEVRTQLSTEQALLSQVKADLAASKEEAKTFEARLTAKNGFIDQARAV